MHDQAATLRAGLVDHLRAHGWIADRAVEDAFRAVPRHAFLPDLPLAEVYTDRSIAIKLEAGVPISSSSQPAIMAVMLELLRPRAGDHVLEIGTGSGYNAALLAALVGRSGSVTTIDLDEDLVAAARARLDAAAAGAVRTHCGDGARGVPAGAPFDAVIATVAVGGVPAAWLAQLRDGGRLVMPLTIRLNQKVVAFERGPHGLTSTAIVEASFMTLRGPFPSLAGRPVALGEPGVVLSVLDERGVDAAALARALHLPAHDHVPQRRLSREEALTAFAFWLGVHDDAICRLSAHGASAEQGVIAGLTADASAHGHGATLGLCVGAELALFTSDGDGAMVIRRFGPDAGAVARLQHALAGWDDAGRPGSDRLTIAAVPGGSEALVLRVAWR